MNYDDLRNYQIKERGAFSHLQKVPSTFYDDLHMFMDECIENSDDDNSLNLIRSVKVCSDEVKKRRFSKIANYCVQHVDNDNLIYPENILDNERELYDNLIVVFKNYFSLLDGKE